MNRTKIPFNDLQVVLNDQLHDVSDLFTRICMFLISLSYNKTMLRHSSEMFFAKSSRVTISYSKVISSILYVASEVRTYPDALITFHIH